MQRAHASPRPGKLMRASVGVLALSMIGSCSSDDTAVAPPAFSKAFDPVDVSPGAVSTLVFTIENTASEAATDLGFADDLPPEIAVADPNNASHDCDAGTLSAPPSGGSITFSEGTVAAGTTCTISVDVVALASGVAANASNDLTSSLGNSGPATADLFVDLLVIGFAKTFVPETVVQFEVSTLTFVLVNPGSDGVLVNSFTDRLPPGVRIAATPNARTDCPSGRVTAPADGSTIEFAMMDILAEMSSCSVRVDVTSERIGTYVNTSDALVTEFGPVGRATAALGVDLALRFSKEFRPDTIGAGEVSTLRFTLDNSASPDPADALDFTDVFPAGLVLASPPRAVISGCVGGTLSAVSGSDTITYSGGSVAEGVACTIQVDVTAAAEGVFANVSGDLTSSFGNSGPATDTLSVTPAPPPTFAKAFTPDAIGAGGVSTLRFTIDNSASLSPADALDFTDNLPAGLTVADPANATIAGCIGGTLTAASGTGTISYTGASLGAGASCALDVDVTAAAAGAFVNTSGSLTSSLGNSDEATDTLTAQ